MPLRHSLAVRAFVSLLGAAVLTPLLLIVGALATAALVWSTTVTVTVPWVFDARYDDIPPGGGVEMHADPGYAAVSALLLLALGLALFGLEKRGREPAHTHQPTSFTPEA